MRASLKTLVLVLSFLLVIGFLGLSGDAARSFLLNLASRPGTLFWSAGQDVSNFVGGVLSLGKLKQENVVLREENLALRQAAIEVDDLKKEVDELREAFGLEAKEGIRLLAAEMHGKRTGEEVLLINRGALDGVKTGDVAVTAGKVLVGRVSKVFERSSEIQLVSARGVSFGAVVQGTQTSGVLRGMGGGRLLLDLIPQDQQFNEGDLVVTSNVAEVFPENLLVGRVGESRGGDVEAFRQAEVSWFFNLSDTNHVFLMQ